jgi:hypothetical protein
MALLGLEGALKHYYYLLSVSNTPCGHVGIMQCVKLGSTVSFNAVIGVMHTSMWSQASTSEHELFELHSYRCNID